MDHTKCNSDIEHVESITFTDCIFYCGCGAVNSEYEMADGRIACAVCGQVLYGAFIKREEIEN